MCIRTYLSTYVRMYIYVTYVYALVPVGDEIDGLPRKPLHHYNRSTKIPVPSKSGKNWDKIHRRQFARYVHKK